MSRKLFLSVGVVFSVAFLATEAKGQWFGGRCPPRPCYQQAVVVVVPVQVCPVIVESVAYAADDCEARPGGEIWHGWFDVMQTNASEHLIRGTLYIPVKNGFGVITGHTVETVAVPCNREVYNSLELGGLYKVECRTRKEWTDLGPTKVRSIICVLESPVNPTLESATQAAPQEETYVPSLKAPLPPAEKRMEELVPARPKTVAPMPPSEKIEMPEMLPPAPTTSTKRKMFQGVRPLRPAPHDEDSEHVEETQPSQRGIAKKPVTIQ
jgi:hypothetical protein